MLYPFIYTATKYCDFRLVTSNSLIPIPQSIVRLFETVARTVIDAENDQLKAPNWVLMKKDGFILWGMGISNTILSKINQDKNKRPTRGFFGFVSDSPVGTLPYSISYFRELYRLYVLPIWDSYDHTEQICCEVPDKWNDETVTKNPKLISDINVERSICRVFPYRINGKELIEAVLASPQDSSIGTNVHQNSSCIGNEELTLLLLNIVMSKGVPLGKREDIKRNSKDEKEEQPSIQGQELANSPDSRTIPAYGMQNQQKGKVLSKVASRDSHSNSKIYLKYGIYCCIIIICLVAIVEGPRIWSWLLPEASSQEGTPMIGDNIRPNLSFFPSEVDISQSSQGDLFTIQYKSSSKIIKVTVSEPWLRLRTIPSEYKKTGKLVFDCTSIPSTSLKGLITVENEEGIIGNIPIHCKSDHGTVSHGAVEMRDTVEPKLIENSGGNEPIIESDNIIINN